MQIHKCGISAELMSDSHSSADKLFVDSALKRDLSLLCIVDDQKCGIEKVAQWRFLSTLHFCSGFIS